MLTMVQTAMPGVHEHSYSNSEHLNNMKLCCSPRPNCLWLSCSMIKYFLELLSIITVIKKTAFFGIKNTLVKNAISHGKEASFVSRALLDNLTLIPLYISLFLPEYTEF